MPPSLMESVLDNFCEDLAGYPETVIADACQDYRRNPDNKFFPTPGQLLAYCQERGVTPDDSRRERMEWLKEYAFDGRWQSNKSTCEGFWEDPHGVGPPPHDGGTLVTEDDLGRVPKAREMVMKFAAGRLLAPPVT